ncbi:MAG: hypothetical protein ABR551_14240, partial [Gemmatimonadales bacterium]
APSLLPWRPTPPPRREAAMGERRHWTAWEDDRMAGIVSESWRLVFGPEGTGWVSPGIDDEAVARANAATYHPGIPLAVRRCLHHPDGRLEILPPEAP